LINMDFVCLSKDSWASQPNPFLGDILVNNFWFSNNVTLIVTTGIFSICIIGCLYTLWFATALYRLRFYFEERDKDTDKVEKTTQSPSVSQFDAPTKTKKRKFIYHYPGWVTLITWWAFSTLGLSATQIFVTRGTLASSLIYQFLQLSLVFGYFWPPSIIVKGILLMVYLASILLSLTFGSMDFNYPSSIIFGLFFDAVFAVSTINFAYKSKENTSISPGAGWLVTAALFAFPFHALLFFGCFLFDYSSHGLAVLLASFAPWCVGRALQMRWETVIVPDRSAPGYFFLVTLCYNCFSEKKEKKKDQTPIELNNDEEHDEMLTQSGKQVDGKTTQVSSPAPLPEPLRFSPSHVRDRRKSDNDLVKDLELNLQKSQRNPPPLEPQPIQPESPSPQNLPCDLAPTPSELTGLGLYKVNPSPSSGMQNPLIIEEEEDSPETDKGSISSKSQHHRSSVTHSDRAAEREDSHVTQPW